MAYARTTLAAAMAATDTSAVVTSATSMAAGNRFIVDQEEMKIAQSYTSGTTIPLLRGQDGTATVAHANGAGVAQGIGVLDWPDPTATSQQATVPPSRDVNLERSIDITATGATGTTSAALPFVTPCNVVATGVSGAGIGIPTGAALPGARYLVNNQMTGALNVYAVGSTINGTTGTTAFAITATGNKMAHIVCVEAGVWIAFGNT